MRALGTFAMPAFLDSASHGGRSGRRDILAAAPIAHIILSNGIMSCSENIRVHIGDSRKSEVSKKGKVLTVFSGKWVSCFKSADKIVERIL